MKIKIIYLDADLYNNDLTVGKTYDLVDFGDDGNAYILDDIGEHTELYSAEYEVVQ